MVLRQEKIFLLKGESIDNKEEISTVIIYGHLNIITYSISLKGQCHKIFCTVS